ncbi:MAG: ABC transporter permease [Deltaproteobacteria bacterium]|nr:ABC transporter permease [Deltaproteobacteria bacterium]
MNRRDTNKISGIIELSCGGVVTLNALAFVWLLMTQPDPAPQFVGDKFFQATKVSLASYVPALSLLVIGLLLVFHGVFLLRRHRRDKRLTTGTSPRPQPVAPNAAPARSPVPTALRIVPGVGYRSFVAWRYLLVYAPRVKWQVIVALALLVLARFLMWLILNASLKHEDFDVIAALAYTLDLAIFVVLYWGVIRYSKLAAIFFVFGIVVMIQCLAIDSLAVHGKLPLFDLEQARMIRQAANGTMIFGGVVAFLAGFFGTMRAGFTFFTTVPIGGVWIGTAALVLVLAVMSGFETDLRDKILGSNAHIQVTKEDGEFVEWREVKKKIDNIPGVVASTPYAVSEVVIAANNNGMNVIIKGIDPDTVAKVTDLVSDLEDKDAMKRMEPLIDLGKDRTTVPQPPKPTSTLDLPPDDMVTGGDPIDFSGGTTPPPTPDAGAGSGSGAGSSGSGSGSADSAAPPSAGSGSGAVGTARAGTGMFGGDRFGGDARIIGLDVEADVLDMLGSDLIAWMVGYEDEPIVHVLDNEPTLSRRTQALPGILVGRELVKQTHLYTGEEVRVVSPLSDPSNPDATGTPIPFNRDYRVAGVFFTGMYEYDLKFVYVTLDSLQDFLDRGDAVDGIEIRLESDDDTERYVPVGDGLGDNAGLIRKALGPGYRVQDWRELNRSLFSALKLEKIAMFLVLGIVILVASFSIIGNLIMVVVEKQREIALLKTLGASDIGVMQLFAVQGMIIGFIGTALGVTTGLLGCLAMEKFGLPLNPDVYYIDRLPIHVDPQSVLAAAVTGVLISIGATLYPALLAARVRPAIGMRH